MKKVDLNQLLDAGVHFWTLNKQKASKYEPIYIYGEIWNEYFRFK